MKPNLSFALTVALLWLGANATLAASPGTAFTYQGRLNDGAQPANGSYDFRIGVFDAETLGDLVGLRTDLVGVPVSNGLFTVQCDAGEGVFDGHPRWLQIAVRTNGSSFFITLVPRQALAAAPYAQYAPSAGTSTVANAVSAGAITSTMLADGAVTSGKLSAGAVKLSSIDDGGIAAYEQFLGPVRSMGTAEPLPFSGLSLVSSNSGAPSFAFTLDGSAFGIVAGFTGREGISEPYEFVVEVTYPSATLNPDAQMGRLGRVTFARNGRSTAFGGIVSGCSVSSYDGTSALYTFRIESTLAYLTLSSDYRIYQQISVPDVVSGLYSTVTPYTLNQSLGGSYDPRELIIQFAESDLNFFSRLLEDEGIFYFFRQDGPPPTLVLGDGTGSYLAAPYSPFRYYGNVNTNVPATGEFIRSFQKAARESTKTATINAYDFLHPTLDLEGSSSSSAGQGETYQFGSSAKTPNAIRAQAGRRRERYEVERATMFGKANAPDLRPGYTFTLDDRTGAGLGASYLVTAVRHSAFRRMTNGVASLYYGNQFEVIPASMAYRPALKTPKPSAQPCTAVVTGPSGEEIFVDENGRVKVQFHWDRYGREDEHSSAWLRVASPWAGNGHGVLFLPRIGDEVMVEFLQGDPDQPVVAGSFHNALNVPPYALPPSKTVSTIKTSSSPGGGNANEIRFEDKTGYEALEITAAKDFFLSAANDTTINTVGDTVIDTAGQMNITAQKLTLSSSQGIGIGVAGDPSFGLKVGSAVAATAFQGGGSGLTNLSAAALTGTINDARLSANVARLNEDQVFSRGVAARVFAGSGAGLTNLPAAALTGTISDARLSGNVAKLNGNPTFSGTVTASLFQGNGAGLTNLSPTNLTGTVPDARLSVNVARLDAVQSFSGANSFFGQVGVGGAAGADALTVNGNARLNDYDLFLRPGADLNHGLGWYGSDKLFGGVNVDGPVLYGCAGGGLGTLCSTPMLALAWNNAGNVIVDPHSANAGAYTPGLTFGAGSMEGIASKRTTGGNQYGLDFYTYGTNRLSLTQSGRVGIGTINPLKALDVFDGSGSNGFGGNIHIGGVAANADPKLIHFGDLQPNGLSYVYLGERGQDDTLELRAGRFYFNTGNVGIGVTNPATPLEVTGTVKATRFEGDGSALTGLSAVRSWQIVTNTSVTALPNRGYVANSASQVTVVLPASAVLGDIVRVAGMGAGGWTMDTGASYGVLTGTANNSIELLCVTNGNWRVLSRF